MERSFIEAVRGDLRIQWPHCYPRSLRVRVREEARTMWCIEVPDGALLIFLLVVSGDISDHGGSRIREKSGCTFLDEPVEAH